MSARTNKATLAVAARMNASLTTADRETLLSLVETCRAIAAETELASLFQRIAERAAVVLRGAGASVILLNAEGRELEFAAASGPGAQKLAGVRFDATRGVAGECLRLRRVVREDAAPQSKLFYSGIDAITRQHTQSLLAAPLIHQNRAIGVVEVVNPIGRDVFSDDDVQMLEIFAAMTAAAAAQAQALDRAKRSNHALHSAAAAQTTIAGNSAALRAAIELCHRAAPALTTVLLLGETGTGKEVAAREIHRTSPRKGEPFVAVNCAALPEHLLESELFGHERGAFTGAVTSTQGRFELAAGGTLFLDEIGEMSLPVQAKILRVVEAREFMRVGGTRSLRADVRLIAATNRDLKRAAAEGRFRDDLYYRLSVFPIELPPLRTRAGDVPILAQHFLSELAPSLGRSAPTISPEAVACLERYGWPGNIREMRNVIERAALLSGPVILPEHLPPEIAHATTLQPVDARPSSSRLDDHERALIVAALERSAWNCSAAARDLGITRDVLRYRIKKFDLKAPGGTGIA